MRLILLGAPGSGKGTQAVKISKKLNIPHISTGDIIRDNIRNETEFGKKSKALIQKGMLVTDDIAIEIIKERLIEDDCANGFILDGFPRTICQAEILDKIISKLGHKVDKVIYIYVADEQIIKRISGRRVCLKCNKSYHLIFNPTKDEGLCDECKIKVIQRDDDTEEIVRNRLITFHQQTEPLIKFYEKTNKLVTVSGEVTIKETTFEIFKVLGIN